MPPNERSMNALSPSSFALPAGDQDDADSSLGGYHLRWSRLKKAVTIKDAASGGFMGGRSIALNAKGKISKNKGYIEREKVILDNISGSASPGEVLACMGPSGAGKTSLMNTLAGRSAHQGGVLSINGEIVTGNTAKRLMSKVAFVKQADIFFGHLSVRDHLTYNALLRLPGDMSRTEKHKAVSEILQTLRLNKVADSPIMLLSGGEKKRVNIGSEILTSPPAILLDEPTSGLDSTSAVSLMQLLRFFARDQGKTVITTIHQPSSQVFFSFDKLILLSEGKSVFFGSPTDSLSYLRKVGLPCPDGYNAADHWMDLLVSGSTSSAAAVEESPASESSNRRNVETEGFLEPGDGKTDENEIFVASDDGDNLECSLHRQNNAHVARSDVQQESQENEARATLEAAWDNEAVAEEIDQQIDSTKQTETSKGGLEADFKKYTTSWTTQYSILLHRALKNSRTAIFTKLNVMKSVSLGVLCGLLWFRTEYTESRVDDIRGYLFFITTFFIFDALFTSLMTFPGERGVILRERASGSYRLSAYFMAKTTSDAPVRLLLPSIFMCISWWMAGFDNRVTSFLCVLGILLLGVLAGESFGLLVGATISDFQEAITFTTVTTLFLMLLGGFYVQDVPDFVSWFKYLSPFKYTYDASLKLIFDRPVPCDGSGAFEELCGGSNEGSIEVQDVLSVILVDGSIGFNLGLLVVLIAIPRYFAYLGLRRQKAGERS